MKKKIERFLDQYWWLEDYHMPDADPVEWKMLRPKEIPTLFYEMYGQMSESSYYRYIYPILHECQHGYNPRVSERDSLKLKHIPRWVLIGLITHLKLGGTLEDGEAI